LCTGGDVATVSSSIYVYMDDNLYFKSGIVIDDSFEGLQSKEFGWVRSVSREMMYNYLKYFKPVNSPVLLLR